MKKIQNPRTDEDGSRGNVLGMPELRPADVLSEKCPSREVLRHISSRWGMLVFCALRDGEQHRFSEIRRTIGGISEKMLSQTLQKLEYDGFVLRTEYPVVPPHVEYRLTELGVEFGVRVVDLVGWLEGNYARIHESQLGHGSSHA